MRDVLNDVFRTKALSQMRIVVDAVLVSDVLPLRKRTLEKANKNV